MKVLLDESVPKALGYALNGHFVRTAQFAGFAGLSNGDLMSAMRKDGYEVLVTFDQNLPYQQNAQLPVQVIVLVAPDNRIDTTLALAPALQKLLDSPSADTLIYLR